MYISMNSQQELNNFFSEFFKNKTLNCDSFKVEHSLFGESEMPLSVIIESLTEPKQSNTFLKQVAEQITRLEVRNVPESRFVEYLSQVAQELTESI